jgi:hypothetical protein
VEEDDDETKVRMQNKGEGSKGKGWKVRRMTEGPGKKVRDGKEKGKDETIVYGRMDKNVRLKGKSK